VQADVGCFKKMLRPSATAADRRAALSPQANAGLQDLKDNLTNPGQSASNVSPQRSSVPPMPCCHMRAAACVILLYPPAADVHPVHGPAQQAGSPA
jgi:hypothetical protein